MRTPASRIFAVIVTLGGSLVFAASASAASSPSPAHRATLGPLARIAQLAETTGQKIATSQIRGRHGPRGMVYGVFIRGTTTAAAIASTGAVPGTVLSVGATADATLGEMQTLTTLPGVTGVDIAGRATRRLDQSVPMIHVAEPNHASTAGVPHLWSGTSGSFAGDTGSGVVVGIVDSGIDLAHADFRTIAGTRVLSLWDQPGCPSDPGGTNTCPAQPPNSQGFTYGSECSQAQINGGTCGPFWYDGDCLTPPGTTRINNASQIPEEDCFGHGTHVAGIAASDGRAGSGGTYIGVAPESDIVAVKADNDLAHIVDGVSYVFKVAAAKGEPASVNLSLGPYLGPHDGTSAFETMLDALTGPGKLIAAAAGNQATSDTHGFHYHMGGILSPGEVRTESTLAETMPEYIDLWYPGGDRISAAVFDTIANSPTPWVTPDTSGSSAPDGTCTQSVPSNDQFQDHAHNTVLILSCLGMANGANEIQVLIFNPTNTNGTLDSAPGVPCNGSSNPCLDTFRLVLRGDKVFDGTFNGWMADQGDYVFHGADASDAETVAPPATAHNLISVGSDVSRTSWPSQAGTQVVTGTVGALSVFSSVGPTRDGRTGLDIVAPGEEIGSSLSAHADPGLESACPAMTVSGCISPNSDGNQHVFLQGTSMAAPHVAGLLALLLSQQPTLTVDQARRILADAADATPLSSGGSAAAWGAGRLQAGPGVITLSPTHGPLGGGGTLDVTGVDLQDTLSMTLGGQALTLTKVGTNHYTAPIPAAAQPGPVDLVITNPDTSTATDRGAFIYDPVSGAFNSVPPQRILDTRAQYNHGTCFDTNGGQLGSCPRLGPFQQMDVLVAGGSLQSVVPANAIAVVLNVTAVSPDRPGYMSIFPTGSPRPSASNLNFAAGRNVPNLVQVLVGQDGAGDRTVRVYNDDDSSDVLMDVAGYYTAPGTGPAGLYQGLTPSRILDTRSGINSGTCYDTNTGTPVTCATLQPYQVVDLQVAAAGGVPGSGAEGVALNVTVTNPSGGGYVTLFPNTVVRPAASNVNFVAGQTVPNRAIVQLTSSGRIRIYNDGERADVIVDVNGWFDNGTHSSTTGAFSPLPPGRIVDTRIGTGGIWAHLTPFGTQRVMVRGHGGVPASASAVVLNVTITNTFSTGAGYLTVYPGDGARTGSSDLNFVSGLTVANLVIVKLGADGSINVYNDNGRTDLIVDVQGWYS